MRLQSFRSLTTRRSATSSISLHSDTTVTWWWRCNLFPQHKTLNVKTLKVWSFNNSAEIYICQFTFFIMFSKSIIYYYYYYYFIFLPTNRQSKEELVNSNIWKQKDRDVFKLIQVNVDVVWVFEVVLTLRRSDRRVSMSVAMDGMSLTHWQYSRKIRISSRTVLNKQKDDCYNISQTQTFILFIHF